LTPFLLALILAGSLAPGWGADPKQLPRPASYVTDFAGAIDPQTESQIEALLVDLERKTSAQVAVVTVASLNNEDIESFANKLFKQWGVGQKSQDNGVLFLISPTDKKMRIEVGYGLEAILPDGYVGRILDQAVVPHFKSGDMPVGIANGTFAIAQAIARDKGVTLSVSGVARQAPAQPASEGHPGFAILVLIIFIYLLIRHPWVLLLLVSRGGGGRGGYGGGGFGGGFGGFGGGGSGGGGASRGW
jgi:uncharacterized protein